LAADGLVQLYKSVSPQCNWKRLLGVAVMAVVFLIAAIWKAKDGLPDISKGFRILFFNHSHMVISSLP